MAAAPTTRTGGFIQPPDTSSGTSTDQQGVNIQVNSGTTSTMRIAMGAVAVLAVLLLAFFIYKSLSVLLLLFIALLIGTAIEPVVMRLRRGPFSRGTGTLVVYSALFLIIGVIAYILISVFVSQLGDFTKGISNSITDMKKGVDGISNQFIRDQATILLGIADNFFSPKSGNTGAPATNQQTADIVTGAALSIVEGFFGVITIFVVAYYWLSERTIIKRSLMTWLPASRANRVHRVWDDVEAKVGGWVRGQLTLMIVVGILSAIGYFVLGIKFWPALALFILIAEAIPLVGPYIGTAPAILVALTQSGNDGLPQILGMSDFSPLLRAVLVVVFAVILQTIEGNVLVPRIMKNSVGISPLTVIISILLGATLAGLAGALVAVPIAGALQVILQDIKAAHVKATTEVTTNAVATVSTVPGENVVTVAVPTTTPVVE